MGKLISWRMRRSCCQLDRRHFCLMMTCFLLKGNYKNKTYTHNNSLLKHMKKNVYFELFKSYMMGNMDYVLDVQSLVPNFSALSPPCNGFCRRHNSK